MTHHRIVWLDLHESVVKDLSHVCFIALRDAGEVIDEGSVKEAELMLHSLQVARQSRETGLPEFSNHEPAFSNCLIEVAHEIEEKVFREMFDGIEAESSQFQFGPDPLTPFLDIFSYFWMVEVDIGEHQVVIIGVFNVDIIGPVLLIADDPVDGFFWFAAL